MDNKEFLLEDEFDLLRKLTETEGWKLLVNRYKPLAEASAQQLRSPDCPNRDWIAGLVTGYDKILSYPEERMIKIRADLLKKRK